MPELPEVEVVRRGLARWVTGRTVTGVEVLHPRQVRAHLPGPDDFAARLDGVTVLDAVRRGKFLWLELDSGEALVAHLGMSGQLVLQPPEAPTEPHLRIRLRLAGGNGRELRFVDQRMFGGMAVRALVPTPDGLGGGTGGDGAPSRAVIPVPVTHIGRDPLDVNFDEPGVIARLRSRRTGVKRALLDQRLVSGIGNIYADEALWAAKLHYARGADALRRVDVVRVLAAVRAVMGRALDEGGTSFDSLYVNVNGESGYFERSLAVYGRAGLPCRVCGTPVRRDTFMNRSSYTCPRCQPRPRHGRW